VTSHQWHLASSSLCPTQVVRQKRVVALPFTGSTSSPEDSGACQILTLPHPRVNSTTAAFLTNSSLPMRLLFTSFFLEGLHEVAHLTDLSPFIAGQPRGSTPRRRPPLSWAHHQELGLDLLLSSMHVELQRRWVEHMRHAEELLLFSLDRAPPPNVTTPPLLAVGHLRQEMV
jgi:hypothetical protein